MKTWGKGKVKRKLGVGAGFIFKGSGFYITDYRSEGYKSGAKSESDSAKPAASDSSKTDSKPKADSPKPAAKTESSSKPAAKKE